MSVVPTEPLRPQRVLNNLGTQIIGREVAYYPSVASTMDIAVERAEEGAAEGLVVLTDEQTAGRGRHGRPWVAPAGSSVLMSILFRPALSADAGNQLSMLLALAAVDAIRAVAGLEAAVKWPNDILVGGSKVAGLLSQSRLSGRKIDYLVVGMGLNVNFDPSRTHDIPTTASSLMLALGRPVDRHALVRAILRAADARYTALRDNQSPLPDWSKKLATLGQRVRVIQATGEIVGTAEDVDVSGNLIVRCDDGTQLTVMAGDVVNLRHRAG
jgi:BirA family biotin operon repressor/biotin-[acetyl-CoA-carboxylase] ligase